MKPTDIVLEALRHLGLEPKPCGSGWSCRCPGHDDRKPSLTIKEGDDGRALLYCHARCATEAVVAELGLTMRDLMPPVQGGRLRPSHRQRPSMPESSNGQAHHPRKTYVTPEEAEGSLAAKFGLPSGTWPYHNSDAQEIGRVLRWDSQDGRKDYRPLALRDGRWVVGAMPEPRPLYRLPELASETKVYVVEGEKAADAAWACGLVASTSAHGSKSASKTDWSPLRGKEVVVMPDNDDAGEAYARDVVKLTLAAGATSVRVVQLSGHWEGLAPKADLVDALELSGGEPLAVLAGLTVLEGDAAEILPEPQAPNDRAPADGVSASWGEVVPLDKAVLPPFPAHALGGNLQRFVEAIAVAFQVPVAMPAILALAVLAAAVAKRFAVRIRDGWTEALTLYVAAIMEPGERKTGTFGMLSAPVEEWEKGEMAALAPGILEKTRARADAIARVNALSKKAASAMEEKTRLKLQGLLKDARTELDEIQVPVPPRVLFDDATAESVGRLLARYGGRLATLASEGGIFETLAGRYANNVPNLDLFLKGWDGKETWRRDRVAEGESAIVRSPILTLGLAVQPDVLRGLGAKQGFRGRGLIGRFLFVLPESLMGNRDVDPPPVPADRRSWWGGTIRGLLDLPDERDEGGEIVTQEIAVTRQGKDALLEFAAEIEHLLKPEGDLRPISDWAGKLVGTTARLAGLLHLADAPGNIKMPVPADAILRAQEIARCLIEHNKAALAEMGLDQTTELARGLLRWILRKGTETFTEREALEGMPRSHRRIKHLHEALEVLQERGYVRPLPVPAQRGPGRPPSRIWETNPAAHPRGGSADSADTFTGSQNAPPLTRDDLELEAAERLAIQEEGEGEIGDPAILNPDNSSAESAKPLVSGARGEPAAESNDRETLDSEESPTEGDDLDLDGFEDGAGVAL